MPRPKRATRPGRNARERVRRERVERAPARRVVGVFLERSRGGAVRAFERSIDGPIEVSAAARHAARDRDVVVVEIERPATRERAAAGRVTERIGSIDEPGTDVRAVIRWFDLPESVPEEAHAAAERLPRRLSAAELRRRTRFDDPSPVTIDGETARDFDDAIAVRELPGGGFRLWVHVADVAHFVEHGDVLDLEARRRGTSVYFPERVLPMLPERLSNDLCSLRPGVDRAVQTVILDFDRHAAVKRAQFADGVIRSAARLTYTQVAAAQAGEADHRVAPALLPMLRAADRLRERLVAARRARGSLDFDLPEPQILLDVDGLVSGIEIGKRNRAHELIEQCMLAANEAVAEFLAERDYPCLYRVHDPPDPLKLEELVELARSLGYAAPAPAQLESPRGLRELLERAAGRPEHVLLSQLTLRTMQQARYGTAERGHFGLAAAAYCHFTSPIRRYPDLVVHRLLRACRRGAPPPVPLQELQETARTSSERERNAEAAERELVTWKKTEYIGGRQGQEFDGVVTGVARFGVFVQLAEGLVEGLVFVERLGDEYFDFEPRRHELRGRSSGRTYRLGDPLRVRVERVDRVMRRVDLALAGTPPEVPGTPRGPRPARGRGTRKPAPRRDRSARRRT